MSKLKLYKWSMLLMAFIATSASAQFFPSNRGGDTRTPGIFGGGSNSRPVIRQDGTRQWPDGTIQYPDGTTRYPDGAVCYPDGTMQYPDGTVRYPDGRTDYPQDSRNRKWNGQNRSNQSCGLPPGQAKKIYGGHARDYAKGKKHCKHHCDGKRERRDDWDDDDDDRNVRRYPQTYPQYPQYPTYPKYPGQNPRGKRTTPGRNPDL